MNTRTTIFIDKKDIAVLKRQGYTLSGFVRAKISELKEKKMQDSSSTIQNPSKLPQGMTSL